jgi:hypothetical protein
MRVLFWLAPALAIAAAISMAGCGYEGEPKPPALKRPEKVTDLAAAERGSKIILTFTLPGETTEGLPIKELPDVELRIGAEPAVWNQAEWETHSDRVPVAAEVLPEKILPSSGSRRASKSTASAKAAQRADQQAKASLKASDRAALTRSVEIDAAKYAGKIVVVGVRVHGPGGRDAGWSRLITLEVAPVLAAPRGLQASDARNAVHLQWVADAPGFRIFRRPAGENDWVQIGESAQASFDDPSADYGKPWQYSVQSVRRAGEGIQESDRSEPFAFTPKDRFPPAVPTGLAAIAGARTIELVWDRVGDSDLAGYRVYRNGQKIADGLLTPVYSDSNVVAGTRYSYQVSAVDQAGNESDKSAPEEAAME